MVKKGYWHITARPKAQPSEDTTCIPQNLLAVVRAVKHFRMYLWGWSFLLRTDHASLRLLINFKDPEGMLARWITVLDVYDFNIQHRAGNKHANADGLTRIECTQCKRHECQGRPEFYVSMRIL